MWECGGFVLVCGGFDVRFSVRNFPHLDDASRVVLEAGDHRERISQ